MKNESTNEPTLSEQYQVALRREAELLHLLINTKSRAEHDAITFQRVKAINETARLRFAILQSDAEFMAANNQFAGNSEFCA